MSIRKETLGNPLKQSSSFPRCGGPRSQGSLTCTVLGASPRRQRRSLAFPELRARPVSRWDAAHPRAGKPGRRTRRRWSPIHAPGHRFGGEGVSATTRRTTGSRSRQLLKVPAWLHRGLDDFPFVGRVWTFTDVDREEAPRCQCHQTLAPTGSCGEEGPPGRPHGLLSAHRPLPGRLPPHQARKAWCQLGGSRSRASGWA